MELMIVVAIGAILVALAVPSFKYVLNDNRMAGEVNDLVGDMQYARAEAVKEGSNVVVCASTTHTGCSGGAAWQGGWIVYSDPDNNGTLEAGETILRVHSGFTSGDTFAPADGVTSSVQFSREGFAVGLNPAAAPALNFELHDSTNTSSYTRCLQISVVGALTTVPYGGTCL